MYIIHQRGLLGLRAFVCGAKQQYEEIVKTDVDQFDLCKMSEFWQSKISKSKNSEQTTMLTRETLLEEDLLSEDFESDFERAYSRAQKEFTREVIKEKDMKNKMVFFQPKVRRKQMVWLVRGLIFGSIVTSAIAVPMALLSVQKSPRLFGAKKVV